MRTQGKRASAQHLNEAIVQSLPLPPAGRSNKLHYFPDAVIQGKRAPRGFAVRVTAAGVRSFIMNYRVASRIGGGGAERRYTIGRHPDWSVLAAVREARELRQRIDRGEDPLEERREATRTAVVDADAPIEGTLKAVCEAYLVATCGLVRREADGASAGEAQARSKATFDRTRSKIRSGDRRIAVFERLVYPAPIARKQIADVKRSELADLLDRAEKERGPQAAQQLLVFLSAMFGWWAARHDDFRTPIVRGMARVKLKDRARKRVLTDDEIRDLWVATASAVAASSSCFNHIVRALLLTALRRNELAQALWAEIEYADRDDYEGNVLAVPAERMKGKLEHAVPLTPAVLTIVGKRPDGWKARPFIFSPTGGRSPFANYSRAKRALDRAINEHRKFQNREPMPHWTLHDLRRTARTLLGRAKIAPHISERVLAHAQKGIEGTYDRWEYLAEKHEALTKLAALVPPPIRW